MLSRVLTRKEQAVLLAVAAALLTGSAAVFWRGAAAPPRPPEPPSAFAAVAPAAPEPPSAAPAPPPASAAPVPAAPPPAPAIAVQVRGAVRRPGVYEFPPGSTVEDALIRAGGSDDGADLDDINLAAPLIDRAALTIPLRGQRERIDDTLVIRRGERAADLNTPSYTLSGSRYAAAGIAPAPAALPGAPVAAGAGGGPLDLNTATSEQLQTLPGIGPKLAADIVAYRERTPFRRPEDLMNVSGIGEKRYDAVKALISVAPR